MLDTEQKIDKFLSDLKDQIMKADVSPLDGQRCVTVIGKTYQDVNYFDGIEDQPGVPTRFYDSTAKTEMTITIFHKTSMHL